MPTTAERKLRELQAGVALLYAVCSPGPVQDAMLAAIREPEGPSFAERLRALAQP